MKTKLIISAIIAGMLSTGSMKAQVSSNPNKFLGNITTSYNVDAGGGLPNYYELWNQITCENESKWASVEGTRNSYNWGCDNAFNYAKQHNFTYKYHALVWGSQYPSWLEKLSAKERFAAITNWYNKVKAKYNTLPMIDVVNEAVGNHQAGNPMMKETLGGGGKTGYDWLIKAFDMAGERWPNAILIYNDYNSIRWDLDNYITLVQTLRDAGAPIDAYGNQAHELKGISTSELTSALKKQQDALSMPMFITEYDISSTDDSEQLKYYKEQIPIMWEKPYCAGVTLWGYVYGKTWTDDGKGYSGIYKDGKERKAMTWLKEYMATDAAKTAVSPFPGTKKEASIYIRPQSLRVAKDDVLPIKVNARLATKTIEKVDFYVNNELVKTMTEAPYVLEVTSSKTGWNTTKAVVTATDGTTYERYGRFNVLSATTKRSTYNETAFEIPGTINIPEYDNGASSVTYSNAARNTTTATKDGQWMDYTVDVKEDGMYSFDATVASTKAGGSFHLSEYGLDNLAYLTEYTDVPKTGGATEWKTIHGQLTTELKAGRHVFTVMVDKGGFYFKDLTLTRYEEGKDITCNITKIQPASNYNIGDTVTFTINATTTSSTIKEVRCYVDNIVVDTLETAPYLFKYVPETKGAHVITAVAFDADGKQKTSAIRKITVKGKRAPYKSMVDIPGIIQAENFDQGGEGLSFHDSDANDEGDANYRDDNEGLDLVKGNGGSAIGYTAKGEWTEYSVNVTEAGDYSFEATCSNGSSSAGGFSISLVSGTSVIKIADVKVTTTGGWNTYSVMKGNLTRKLATGEQILRFTITDGNCNIDKVKFICTTTGIQSVSVVPASINVYNLYGVKVGTMAGWQNLPRGIYVVNGRKVTK